MKNKENSQVPKMRRDSFIFYTSWLEGIDAFTYQEQAEIIFALARYCAYGIEPDLTIPHVKMAYLFNKPSIDKNYRKYLNRVGKTKEEQNNNKRRTKQQQKNIKQEQNGKSEAQRSGVDVDVDVDVDDNVSSNGTKPQKRFVPPTIEQVEKYIKEKGYRGVNAQTLVSHYDAQGWKRNNGRPITSWQSAVRYWASKSKGHLEVRKKELVQDETRLGGINRWMIENTPFLVDFMEHLFTAEEIEWLCEKYGSAKIAKVLEILEDRKEYTKKHTNLYLTVKEWIDKEPPSETPSEPQPQSEQDDYFAWLPQDASPLYRDFYIHLLTCNSCFFDKAKDKLPTQDEFQSLVDKYGYEIVEYASSVLSNFTDKCPDLYSLLVEFCPEEKEWRNKHGK